MKKVDIFIKSNLIIGKTMMAHGCANMEGDHETHGAPLPPDEIAATKQKMGLNPEDFFYLPEDVLNHFREGFDFAKTEVQAWNKSLEVALENSDFRNKWETAMSSGLPSNVDWPKYKYGESIATRKVWGGVIEPLADCLLYTSSEPTRPY